MSWLIFGGTGQLGLEISSVLKAKGIDFVSIGSNVVDITQKDEVFTFVNYVKPHYIINAAAWTDVDSAEVAEEYAYSVNALGAKYLAQSSVINDAIFVQISTDYVFSGDRSVPWLETSACNPKTAYGRTKFAAEELIKQEDIEKYYIFRTAWLYSKFGNNFVKLIIEKSYTNNQIKIINDQFGQPTSAKDLANQIINSLLAKIPFGLYHGTNYGEASWLEFASRILEFAKIDSVELIPINSSELSRLAKRPNYSVLGHDKWIDVNFPAMRNWKVALYDTIPSILESLKNK